MASFSTAEHQAIVDLRRDLVPGIVHLLCETDAPVGQELKTAAMYYLREKYQIIDNERLELCTDQVHSWLLRLIPSNRR